MAQLKYLAGKGICFHTQLVLCPGYNDGPELDKSIRDLLSFHPNVLSIGAVPVGLTRHRFNLEGIENYNHITANETLEPLKKWQLKIKNQFGENFLYIADEFYFLANESIPQLEDYHDFPQMENGIGLTRFLWEEFSGLFLPERVRAKTVGIITGILGMRLYHL